MSAIRIVKTRPYASFWRATPQSLGFDLTICHIRTLGRDKVYMIRAYLGVKVSPPPHISFDLVVRSSTPLKVGWGLANGVGIIDPDYRGEWMALLVPVTPKAVDPENLLGIRMLQAVLRFNPILPSVKTVKFLDVTGRGEGGFGSTDTLK